MVKFKGNPYPVVKHPLGYFHIQSGTDQIRSDLISLIMTNPGERPMLPTFGTPLDRFLFEPNDTILAMDVRNAIIESIRLWDPRVTITNIEVSIGLNSSDINDTSVNTYSSEFMNDNDHSLSIKINFIDPENITDIQELVLQVPLSN
jgi:phage baseplate assembly protein W